MTVKTLLPPRYVRRRDVTSRLVFHWRADGRAPQGPSLDAVTGQSVTITRASAGGYVVGRDGYLRNPAHSQPRFTMYDLDGDGIFETPALLVEQDRINLLLRSEEFDNASWTKLNAAVTANVTMPIAPNRTLTADRVVDDATNAEHHVEQAVTIAAGLVAFCLSVFVKADTLTKLRLRAFNGADGFRADFDASAKTVLGSAVDGAGVVHKTGIDKMADGWCHCWVAGRVNASSTAVTCRINLLNAAGSVSYAGTTQGLWLWGAMCEVRPGDDESAYVGSYIPTTTATVQRELDFVRYALGGIPPQDITCYVKFVPTWLDAAMSDHNATPMALVETPDGLGNNYMHMLRSGLSDADGISTYDARVNHQGPGGFPAGFTSTTDVAIPAGVSPLEWLWQYDHQNARVRLDPGSGVWSAWTTVTRFNANLMQVKLGTINTQGELNGGLLAAKVARGLLDRATLRSMV